MCYKSIMTGVFTNLAYGPQLQRHGLIRINIDQKQYDIDEKYISDR